MYMHICMLPAGSIFGGEHRFDPTSAVKWTCLMEETRFDFSSGAAKRTYLTENIYDMTVLRCIL